MKTFITAAMILISSIATSQDLSIENPVYEKNGIRLELKECTEFRTLVKYQSIDTSSNRVIQEGHYRDGKRDGIWYMYDYRGNLSSTMVFRMDQRIKLTGFDESGEETTIFYENNRPVRKMTVAYLD